VWVLSRGDERPEKVDAMGIARLPNSSNLTI
jgi:hypothetical protein